MGAETAAVARRRERGETLIETIIAMAIITVVAIVALSGVSTTIKVGVTQRMSAQGETLLRSAAEQIQNPSLAYVPRAGCPGASRYAIPAPTVAQGGFTVAVTSVEFWAGASATPSASVAPTFRTQCPPTDSADPGLQRVVITVSHSDGRTDRLTVVKRRS